MGEVGGTDFHYDGERQRPAYAWRCPSCQAANMGRTEDGCPQCHAGQDGKVVGIPQVARRRSRTAPVSRGLMTPIQSAPPAPSALPAPVTILVSAAVLVLQYVHPSTQDEIDAMQQLKRAVAPFTRELIEGRYEDLILKSQPIITTVGRPPMGELDEDRPEDPAPPLPSLAQDWDARTILTIAAALDHFAEQILVNLTSDDFLSADEAQDLANQLRATLPEDLDSVLPVISAEEPQS